MSDEHRQGLRDGRGRFLPGARANPHGRPVGVRNKFTTTLKEALLGTFEELGGRTYLLEIAREHPQVFCQMLSRLIPAEIEASLRGIGAPVVVVRDYSGRGPVVQRFEAGASPIPRLPEHANGDAVVEVERIIVEPIWPERKLQ